MKKTSLFKKLGLYLGMALCMIFLSGLPSASMTVHAASENTASPNADVLTWVYKVEDGAMYKRLYNTSLNIWETDWIYVCEYPGKGKRPGT